MSKLNHGRSIYAQRKVKAAEIRELEEKPDPGLLRPNFGKYANRKIHLAELALNDPQYFYWGYCSGAFKQDNPWLEFQAWEIIQKVAHIVPPRSQPNDWEFAIQFDRSNRFMDFQIVKKTKTLKAIPGLLRVKHLDISLVSLASEKACAKMVERIHEKFFPDGKLSHWDYQEFFDNDRNFDMSCRELHCPKILRRMAVKRKCPNYDGEDLNP